MILKELKTDPTPFWDTWHGKKTHELRYDDRNYSVGDHLLLRETKYTAHEMALGNVHIDLKLYVLGYEEHPLEYTGREILAKVTHILRDKDGIYGLKAGWCILSIEVLSRISTAPEV
jgi:hypothetical protein